MILFERALLNVYLKTYAQIHFFFNIRFNLVTFTQIAKMPHVIRQNMKNRFLRKSRHQFKILKNK